ncbi:MAG: hypothetical protein KDD34_09740 [Bdellovibrionales bacterium]|nr:hypothetical protein [Bdellovibrionales bacterium]
MRALNSKLLKKFLKRASEDLTGEWLLVGGTLLPALGIDARATVDIDLINLKSNDNNNLIQLMKLADNLKLPIESINQAAAYFLKDIKYSQSDLFILSKGKKAIIYRPSLALYWKLKIPRLTESDLLDCQHYFDFCKSQSEIKNTGPLKKFIQRQVQSSKNPSRTERLETLLDLL